MDKPPAEILAELLLVRLDMLKPTSESDQIEIDAWTVQRTADEIRQLIGPVLCGCVDELEPGLLPDEGVQRSLADCRSLYARLLRQRRRRRTRETVSPEPYATVLASDKTEDDLPEVTPVPTASPAEMPVRPRTWAECWQDLQRYVLRIWRRK